MVRRAIPHAGFAATSRAAQALHMKCTWCCQYAFNGFNVSKLGFFCGWLAMMNFIIHVLLRSLAGDPRSCQVVGWTGQKPSDRTLCQLSRIYVWQWKNEKVSVLIEIKSNFNSVLYQNHEDPQSCNVAMSRFQVKCLNLWSSFCVLQSHPSHLALQGIHG